MNSGANMSNIDEWFHEMVESGLVSRSSTWIERAVNQKHPRVKLDLAHSVPLVYDNIDNILVRRETLN
jgi:hypothetical protein